MLILQRLYKAAGLAVSPLSFGEGSGVRTPRRIILTVTNDLTYDQRMQRICTSLSAAGYEVELLGREVSTSQTLDEFPFAQIRLKCWLHKGKLFYLEYNIRLFFYLLFHRADIICSIDLDTIVAGYYAARLKGAKIVYDAHELFPEVPEVVRRPGVQKVWRWVERKYVPKVDLVYTVSQSISELFEKEYKRPVYTIRNLPVLEAIPSSESRLLKPPLLQVPHVSSGGIWGPPYLLYQGALNEGRGLEHLISAMKDIDIDLYIIGEGDISNQLKEQTKQLGLENKVRFLGFKKPDELKQITAQAYIGLNLLEQKGSSYYYSLANKFSDYIHAGIPQICINFPEYKRINDKYNIALLIDNLDQETIKSAVNSLVSDKKKYGEFKENCLVCRQELNWQAEEKKLISLYERLN
jgi:glycosyltransferase involved in cell wall biosynthesis